MVLAGCKRLAKIVPTIFFSYLRTCKLGAMYLVLDKVVSYSCVYSVAEFYLYSFRYQVVGGIPWHSQPVDSFMDGAGIRLTVFLFFMFLI